MSYPIKPETRLIQADNRGRLALNPWTDRHAQYTVERYPDGTMVVRPFQVQESSQLVVKIDPRQLQALKESSYAAGGIVTDPRNVRAGEYVMPHEETPRDSA